MIRIGIDCRALTKPSAGISRYILEIMNEFSRLAPSDVKFFLYAPRGFKLPDAIRGNAQFVVRMANHKGWIWWLHAVLPFLLFGDRVDIFWGPNYALPVLKFHKYSSVITVHDATFARFPKTMKLGTRMHNRFMLPLYGRLSRMILTDSQFSMNELIEVLGVDSRKVRVIPLGSIGQGTVTPTSLRFGQSKYVLCVCTMEPRKNVERLIQAYSALPDELREEYHLIFAGAQGWGNIDPISLMKKYGVEMTSSYLGGIDDEHLVSLYQNATLFVFPSLYEGFGLPVLEAMSFNVPVICSNGSSLGELTEGAALYCDMTSVIELSAKIELALTDVNLRSFLRDRGKCQAATFDWHATAQRTLECLIQEGTRGGGN